MNLKNDFHFLVIIFYYYYMLFIIFYLELNSLTVYTLHHFWYKGILGLSGRMQQPERLGIDPPIIMPIDSESLSELTQACLSIRPFLFSCVPPMVRDF